MVFSPPFPIILGGEIFWTLSIFGSFLLIFFHPGGKTHGGGTDKYLGASLNGHSGTYSYTTFFAIFTFPVFP